MDLLAGFGAGTRFVRCTEKRIVFHLATEVGTTVAEFAKRLVGSLAATTYLCCWPTDGGREGKAA